MLEFFNETFSWVNIIPTGFLVFTLIYWLSVLIGMLDMNFLDVNVDKHLSIDKHITIDKNVSIDKNIDKDIAKNLDVSWLNAVLSFFNLGKIPFMVFLTFWALPMWFISLIINHYLGISSILLSLVLLIPNIVVSLFVSKALTQPLVKVFAKLETDETDDDFETKLGIAITNVSHDKPGQIEIKNKGVHIRLNAISMKEKEIERDTKVIVIQYLEDKDLYLIDVFE